MYFTALHLAYPSYQFLRFSEVSPDIKRAQEILSQRFNLPTRIIIGDHLPKGGDAQLLRMGEVQNTQLTEQISDEECEVLTQGRSGFINDLGEEYLDCKRNKLLNEAINNTGVIISSDSASTVHPVEYLNRLNASRGRSRAFGLIAAGSTAFGTTLFQQKKITDPLMSRRSMLKFLFGFSGVAAAATISPLIALKEQGFVTETDHYKDLPDYMQKLVSIFPYEKWISYRDTTMVINSNSAMNLDFGNMLTHGEFFAGEGHRGTVVKMLKEPQVLLRETQEDLLRIFTQIIQVYIENYTDPEKKIDVTIFLSSILNLFPPIVIRNLGVNKVVVKDDTEHSEVCSSSVLMIRTLTELLSDIQNNLSPFLTDFDKKVALEAINYAFLLYAANYQNRSKVVGENDAYQISLPELNSNSSPTITATQLLDWVILEYNGHFLSIQRLNS